MSKEDVIKAGNLIGNILNGMSHEDVEMVLGWLALNMLNHTDNKIQMDGRVNRALAVYDEFCREQRELIAESLIESGWRA